LLLNNNKNNIYYYGKRKTFGGIQDTRFNCQGTPRRLKNNKIDKQIQIRGRTVSSKVVPKIYITSERSEAR
jgi:hypothetical protein